MIQVTSLDLACHFDDRLGTVLHGHVLSRALSVLVVSVLLMTLAIASLSWSIGRSPCAALLPPPHLEYYYII